MRPGARRARLCSPTLKPSVEIQLLRLYFYLWRICTEFFQHPKPTRHNTVYRGLAQKLLCQLILVSTIVNSQSLTNQTLPDLVRVSDLVDIGARVVKIELVATIDDVSVILHFCMSKKFAQAHNPSAQAHNLSQRAHNPSRQAHNLSK